jgi:hypothetical protein
MRFLSHDPKVWLARKSSKLRTGGEFVCMDAVGVENLKPCSKLREMARSLLGYSMGSFVRKKRPSSIAIVVDDLPEV